MSATFFKWGFALGAEIVGAERFGMGRSFEGWTGLNVRYTEFVFSTLCALYRALPLDLARSRDPWALRQNEKLLPRVMRGCSAI